MSESKPAVVAINMGYGHMRAALPLAEALQTEMLLVDAPPLAAEVDERHWRRLRAVYENISRLSTLGGVGKPMKALLDEITDIPPLHPRRDQSAPHLGVHALNALVDSGAGQTLAQWLKDSGRPLLTTFYAPAIMADRLGCTEVYCVITDSDLNRIWVAKDPTRSNIRYFAPSSRVVRRLRAYGVPASRIEFTGFPLPPSLTGPNRETLKQNLKKRLVRLDPRGAFAGTHGDLAAKDLGELPNVDRPPRIAFAIGGAGAQTQLARTLLESLRPLLLEDRLQLVLVAGIRKEVADKFRGWLDDLGLANHVEILLEADFRTYYAAFNAMLADVDVLWSKPSEITFYAALGIPLVCSSPVGVHEHYNRRWLVERGAGLEQRDPHYAGDWFRELLDEGVLALAAWNAYASLPGEGTRLIAEHFQ